MEKSELRFKCVASYSEAKTLCSSLTKINIEETGRWGLQENQLSFFYVGGGTYSIDVISPKTCETFNLSNNPFMAPAECLKLIESIEPDAPEFDIKFCEKCLGRNHIDQSWKVVSFGAAGNQAFATLENGSISMVTPLTRDTFLNKNNIAGWWECENGKPVWRTK